MYIKSHTGVTCVEMMFAVEHKNGFIVRVKTKLFKREGIRECNNGIEKVWCYVFGIVVKLSY